MLAGSIVRRFFQRAAVVAYRIETDERWRSRHATIEQFMGGKRVVQELERGSDGWLVGGKREPRLDACMDLDLEASPVTNTVAIKGSEMRVGQRIGLTAAWVRFPSLRVQPLEQSYERIGKRKYRYRSASGFVSEIEVDGFGIVRRYGRYWLAV